MKRTILIPTDYTVESLNLVRTAIESGSDDQLEVILFHCIRLSDSILELLFSTHQKKIGELENKAFRDACKVIRNSYDSKLIALREEIFSGTTQAAFQNFLDANRVKEIIIPKNYKLKQPSKYSVDPLPFIHDSGLLVVEVSWEAREQIIVREIVNSH